MSMATGLGKSWCFSHVPLDPNRRALLLVNTIELVEQGAANFRRYNPDLSVGIEMASQSADSSHQIVCASVQTLGREYSDRIKNFDPREFQWVHIDEAHRSLGQSYVRVINYFHEAIKVGWTATPRRSDGQALARIFDEIVYHYGTKDAIRDGWLVVPRGYRLKTNTDISNVSTGGNLESDFNQAELQRVVNTEVRNRLIVEQWRQIASDRLTIAFTSGIEHAVELAQAFQQAGVRAEAVWGTDPDRHGKLERLRRGEIRVICNAQLLTEGFDCPELSCCIMARPTNSQTFFIQCVGRVLRLFPGKTDAIVMDVADKAVGHSLESLPSIFGLPPRLNLEGRSVIEAAEEIEKAELLRPDIDLSNLESVQDVRGYIEQVDLFNVAYSPEVLQMSEYQWHKTSDGRYVLLLPGKERVDISQDFLGRYTIEGIVGGKGFEDQEADLATAFYTADKLTKMFGRALLKEIRREVPKKKELATPSQVRMLTEQLNRRGALLPDFTKMSKHQAAKVLRSLVAA